MNRLCEKLLDKCYTDITVEDIKTLINYLDEREQQQAVMIVLGMAEVPEFKDIIFKITVKFNKTSTSWYSFSDWKRLEQRDIDPNKK